MPKLSGVSQKRAVKAFEKAGFWIAHQGGHIKMTNGISKIELPRHDPINPYTMAAIVKQAGLTVEQFKNLM